MGLRYNPITGRLEQAAPQPEIQVDNSKPVSMIDDGGRPVLVPGHQAQTALSSGYKLETAEQTEAREMQEQYGDQSLRTGLEAGAAGYTFGLSDVILSQFDKEGLRKRRLANPEAAMTGEVIGTTAALLTPFYDIGATAGIAGRAAAKGIGNKIAAKALEAGVRGGIEGAAIGAGQALSEKALGNPDQFGEILYSKMGMNALTGFIGGSVLDLGFAGLGKVASKGYDLAEPFIPGAYQAVDPLTGAALPGTKAAIARGVNEITSSLAQATPFVKQPPKEVLFDALNNPAGRRRVLEDSVRDEIVSFSREAAETIKGFNKDLGVAKTEVRQELDGVIKAVTSKKQVAAEDIADQVEVVYQKLAENNKAVQEMRQEVIKTMGEPAKGTLYKGVEHLETVLQKMGADDTIPQSYKQQLINTIQSVMPAEMDATIGFAQAVGALRRAGITEGEEIARMTEMRRLIGDEMQPLLDRAKSKINPLDTIERKTLGHLHEAYDGLGSMLKNPEIVGKSFADIQSGTDKAYSVFKTFEKARNKLTAARELDPNTGLSPLQVSERRGALTALDEKRNTILQKALDNVKDYEGDATKVVAALRQVQDLKGIAESEKQIIKDFLKSPQGKDPDALYEFAQSRIAKSARVEELGNLKKIQSQLENDPDLSRFEKAVKVKLGRGEISKAKADELLRDYKDSRIYANYENMQTGQQGSIAAQELLKYGLATSAAGPLGAAGVAAAMPITNTLGYMRVLDGIKRAGVLRQNEIATTAVKFLDSLVRKSTESTIRAKVTPRIDFKEAVEQVEKSYEQLPNVYEAQIFQYVPKAVVPSMVQTHARAVNFLKSKIPQNPASMFPTAFDLSKSYKPTDDEKKAFIRYFGAVNNPQDVLADFSKGIIRPDAVEALKNVYPEIYNQISQTIMEVANSGAINKMSYERKMQLAIWFGTATDPTVLPESVLSQQQSFQPKQQPQPQNINFNAMSKSVDAKMTGMQRLQRS